MKKSIIVIVLIALLGIGGWTWTHRAKTNSSDSTNTAKGNAQNQGFNKKQFSLTDPKSIWVIADKHRPLQPKTYAPDDLVVPDIPLRLTTKDDEMKLRKEAADALKELYNGAAQDGLKLMVSSGYRSYAYQVNLYNYYVKQQGKAVADSQSARPGFSEHQTGLAVDVEPASRTCEVEACFAKTPEGKWVAANAYKYGFVVRYQDGKQETTGYIYEPWHIRYVGKSLAAELQKQGNPTLEDFFGLEAAPDYL
jgi:D-alanyl-D-alanine carboxypeptidase